VNNRLLVMVSQMVFVFELELIYMHKIPIIEVKTGRVLGKNIYAANGQVLLTDGTVLNTAYIERLRKRGFFSVIIKEDYQTGLHFPEIVSEKARVSGVVLLHKIFEEAGKFRRIDTGAIKSLANVYVDELQQNRKLLFEIPEVRSAHGYLFQHSVNVCIMAIRVGLMLEYNEFQLRDLGVGAILHDIGKMFVDKKIMEKTGLLTPEESEKLKEHCYHGFNFLREQKDINLLSAHVPFQHHERVDGTGYPRMLKGEDMSDFAKIVAVADMFDNLTNEKINNKVYSFSAAINMIKNDIRKACDCCITELFFKNIALFPVGTLVELSSKEIGLVVSNNRVDITRPIVRIVTDKNKRVLNSGSPIEIDLINEQDLKVVKVVDNDEKLVSNLNKFYSEEGIEKLSIDPSLLDGIVI
jgi:HD-GYP domain-containing protein (c-di-GMP phosphodiesterase class II)